MAKKGRGIFLVYTDIDPQYEEEFNAWYNTEHLPELLSLPGFLDAARYVAYKGVPKYLAVYELESAEALVEYHPEALAERIAPRPLLLVHGEADRLVPVEESRSIAVHAGPSCRLEVIPSMGHFDWVMPSSPGFRRVADLVVEFLSEALPV